MNRINFSHNWNDKLDARIFTTIRGLRGRYGDKYKYYLPKVGKPFRVVLNGKDYSLAELVDVDLSVLGSLPKSYLMQDTGTVEYSTVFEDFGLKNSSLVVLLGFENKKWI